MVVGVVNVDAFKRDGFVKIEQAVPAEIADAARHLLWTQIGLSADDPASWTAPVVWTADLTGAGAFGQVGGQRPARRGPGPDLRNRRLASAGLAGQRPGPVSRQVRPRGTGAGTSMPTPRCRAGSGRSAAGRDTVLVLTLLSEVGPD